jgi:hypothetical protein
MRGDCEQESGSVEDGGTGDCEPKGFSDCFE